MPCCSDCFVGSGGRWRCSGSWTTAPSSGETRLFTPLGISFCFLFSSLSSLFPFYTPYLRSLKFPPLFQASPVFPPFSPLFRNFPLVLTIFPSPVSRSKTKTAPLFRSPFLLFPFPSLSFKNFPPLLVFQPSLSFQKLYLSSFPSQKTLPLSPPAPVAAAKSSIYRRRGSGDVAAHGEQGSDLLVGWAVSAAGKARLP